MKASRASCRARSAIAHAPKRRRVVGPAAAHAHPGLEVDLAAEELLDVPPRLGGDRLELTSAGANDDRLVPVLLDDDGGVDASHAALLLVLVDLDVDAVGELLA